MKNPREYIICTIVALICLLYVPINNAADRAEKTDNADSIFVKPDKPCEPIGGMEAIINNIHYPEAAKDAGIQGKVIVSIIVDEKGNPGKPEVIKSIDKSLDGAAIEAVKSVKFRPAIKDGIPVKSKISLPVSFKLENAKSNAKKYDENLDEPPEPVGGMQALLRNVKYPAEAASSGLEGNVFIRFTVDESGNPSEFTILSETNPILNDAAIKAIKSVKFQPGKKGGVPKKGQVVMPIVFKLH